MFRAPSLLISAVVCLGVGIGASATMLGAVDQLLFRSPNHVGGVDRIKRIYYDQGRGEMPQSTWSYPMYADLAGKVGAFSELAAYFPTACSLGLGKAAQPVQTVLATPSFFRLVGVQPLRGRLFTEAEGDPTHAVPVALVSWELCQRTFAGTSKVLGRQIRIQEELYTVVGVLPRRFTGVGLEPVDVWLPIGAAGSLFGDRHWAHKRTNYFLELIGRLRPGVGLEQAAQEATSVHREAYAALPKRGKGERSVSLGPVQPGWGPEGAEATRVALWVAGTALAVLLLACINVAHLLILRGVGRHRELAIRLALGASRLGIARLLLLEALVLALFGGLAAGVTSRLFGRLVQVFLLPAGATLPGALDLRWLALLTLLSLGAGLASGLGPALAERRHDLAAVLQGSAQGGGPLRTRWRTVLLTTEMTFTIVLLLGAGLFVRSLQHVLRLDLGFKPEQVLLVTADPTNAGATPTLKEAFYRQVLERVRRLPGVEQASLAAGIPFRSSFGTSLETPERGDVSRLAPGGVYYNAVSNGFFETMGAALRLGRTLTVADELGAESVAVVNETMARLLWPRVSPLGRCIELSASGPCVTVVGVVADLRRQRLREPPTMQFYIPLAQAPGWMTQRALFVRGRNPERFAARVRQEILAEAPELPYIEAKSLQRLLDSQIRPWSMGATLLSVFALLALGIAVVGLFCAVAYVLAARTHELGIRMALGARSWDLQRQALGLGLAPAALGAALGVALSAAASRFVQPLLFDVPARDGEVTVAVVLLTLAAAFAASYLATLRVRQVDPTEAMRIE